jgi:hypothetical protein
VNCTSCSAEELEAFAAVLPLPDTLVDDAERVVVARFLDALDDEEVFVVFLAVVVLVVGVEDMRGLATCAAWPNAVGVHKSINTIETNMPRTLFIADSSKYHLLCITPRFISGTHALFFLSKI